jgi:2-hydroxychromene-2-carboxylate isomerase
MITVVRYTIFDSPNCYLGLTLAERALAGLPVLIDRRPICVPKSRRVKVADLVGGRETPSQSSYHREDCRRWAETHGIELRLLETGVCEQRAERWRSSAFDREELPARAFYSVRGSGRGAVVAGSD